jgi:hypothetical protein
MQSSASSAAQSIAYYVSQLRIDPEDPTDGSAPVVKCLPPSFFADANGSGPCNTYFVSPPATAGGNSTCSCDTAGLSGPVHTPVRDSINKYLYDNGICDGATQTSCDDECVCQLAQAEGDERSACQNGQVPADKDGWCFVDPDAGLGSSDLVAACLPTQRQALIFYDTGASLADGLIFIGCAMAQAPLDTPALGAAVGAPCVPSDEYRPTFNDYALAEVVLDDQSRACDSGICLVNHFQGRVSCPYGQTQDELAEPQCFLPASNTPVTVAVDPQRVARQAAQAVTCSCRCDGPGDGPFCTCPRGMECAPVIQALGFPNDDVVAGSYCIPSGAAYDPQAPIPPATCGASPPAQDCGDPRPF